MNTRLSFSFFSVFLTFCLLTSACRKSRQDSYDIVNISKGMVVVQSKQPSIDENTGKAFYPQGLVDGRGGIRIPVVYEQILPQDSIVCARSGGKWGLLDMDGNVVTPFRYDRIGSFLDGYAIVQDGAQQGVIGSDGRIAFPLSNAQISPFYQDYAMKGREKYQYEAVFYIKDGGHMEVRNLSRRQNPRSETGHIESPYDYQMVEENGKYGFINYLGERIPCQYENERDTFSQGLAAVVLHHKIGFIDKRGTVRIPFAFDYEESIFNFFQYGYARFSEGLCAMRKDGKFGYIDMRGETVIPYEYDNATFFQDGRAVVYRVFGSQEKAGMIDRKGSLILPFEYDYIGVTFGDGEPVRRVMKQKKWGLCSLQGETLADCVYDDLSLYQDGLYMAKKDNCYGLVDIRGHIVLPCEYEWIFPEGKEDGLFLAKKNGKWGIVNPAGKQVISFSYDDILRARLNGQTVFLATAGTRKQLFDRNGRACSLSDLTSSI